ncbi:MAG: cation:proton antiporter [Thermoanaerobaculia bacterium]|nr:Na(+)/H(+)-K(+) antiporter GerN [Thermoanaerobaculia bacterium]MCK6685855.1 cation:proton antiporter [Thermoanaerobaculia bacterium]
MPLTTFELSVRFFLQLVCILMVCQIAAWVFRRLGQSQVVSEMIAGVLLGPSLLGWLWPEASAFLFPKQSMPILFSVAQVALVLYMFLVGLEFDLALIKARAKSAVSVSAAGITMPFALGAGIAIYLTNHPEYPVFGQGVSTLQAILFTGAAMSITAFPMLARIIHEQGLSKTALGTLALAAGSIDDAAAWCLLAIVLSAFSNDPKLAIMAVGGGGLFLLFTLVVVRRLLAPLGNLVKGPGEMSSNLFTQMLAIVMLGAFITDVLHIYAVFGAFLIGAAMPKGHFAEELRTKIEPLTVGFLLPLFFVYSGLNTKIGLVSTPALAVIALVVLLAACLGKGVACWAAARLSGENNRDALATGALMNARGLMELIILNIGLERGIIQPTMFTIMVVMAIVTTLMATPIFERVYGRKATREAAIERGFEVS